MSDFDLATASSEDPAAEFLAREQSALGDLDEDFAFNKESQPSSGEPKEALFSSESKLNGDFANEFEDQSNGDIVNNGLSNGVSDLSINGNKQEQPSIFSQPILPPEEPESIKKWREEHIIALEKKDEDEKVKIEELKEQGKRELEEWYARYEEQLAKAKQQNRNAEKEWIAERDNESQGKDWEKITRLCDFNPKTSRNTKDTSRMRSILLQVKQTPPASSAAQEVSS